MEATQVDTSALGVKHTCSKCDARFFDLNKTPAVCPKCETTVETEKKPRVRRAAKETPAPQPSPKKTVKSTLPNTDLDDDDNVDIGDDDDVDVDIDDDIDLDDDDDDDDDLMEDASDLGGDEDDDMSGIIEHIDDDNEK
ncbi:FYDLN acid domain-containing protein [Varunaivibrio sulfuroxidans]|nr:FYDLN acid domain-containing protein [Varunaivibrio sulfuroxidans]WES32195.1 FYDLN acid domain-containing protein [Varunaivibrio sulfuroxidans]